MRISTTVFQEYLSPEEIVLETGDGSIIEGSASREGFVGLTDRRLLFVSDDGGFTDVDYEHVCSIQSRTRQTFTERGLRLRVAGALGALLALAAFVATVVLTWSALGAVLALVSIGGAVAAEALRRKGVDVDWNAMAERIPRLDAKWTIDAVDDESANGAESGDGETGPTTNGRATTDDEQDELIQQHWETEYVYLYQFLLFSAVAVAVAATVGLLALTGGVLVLALTVATLCGITVTDVAARRIRRLDSVGESRRTEREVRIELVNGRDVSVRFNATAQTDRLLSRLAKREHGEAIPRTTESEKRSGNGSGSGTEPTVARPFDGGATD